MKVLLRVPLSTFSGYGNDGVGMTQAFLRAGCDVYLQPTVVQAPIPPEVALLLSKPVQEPFDLSITHVDPMQLEGTEGVQRASTMSVGWTMWEWNNLRNMPKRSSARTRWKNFDALIGYDQNTVEGVSEFYRGPVIKQQGGYDPAPWPVQERDWDDPRFFFCQIGQLTQRKDPFKSIQAFGELKNEDAEFNEYARLSLKTSVPGLHSKMEDVYPGLRIFYDSWPQKTVLEFYKANHVLLAPSKGEGKNLPALEFMTTGGTVIATNWGGHREWLHPDYAYALDWEEDPTPGIPGNFNASASVEHLKELMLHAFRNRSEVRTRGLIASSVIPGMCSWDAVIIRLIDKLKETGTKGEKVALAFEMANAERKEPFDARH